MISQPIMGEFLVSPLIEEEIDEVVALHRATLDYSINSRLGAKHLASLYKTMLSLPSCIIVVAHLENKIVGVASATSDPNGLKRVFLRQCSVYQWSNLLIKLVLHPKLLLEWISFARHDQPVYWKNHKIKNYLSAITVNDHYQNKGIGSQLINHIDAFFITNGFSIYYLDTRVDNLSSRAFYKRNGFIETEQRGQDVILIKELINA